MCILDGGRQCAWVFILSLTLTSVDLSVFLVPHLPNGDDDFHPMSELNVKKRYRTLKSAGALKVKQTWFASWFCFFAV